MPRAVGDFIPARGDIAERAVAPFKMGAGGDVMMGERVPGGVRRIAMAELRRGGDDVQARVEERVSARGRYYEGIWWGELTVRVVRGQGRSDGFRCWL